MQDPYGGREPSPSYTGEEYYEGDSSWHLSMSPGERSRVDLQSGTVGDSRGIGTAESGDFLGPEQQYPIGPAPVTGQQGGAVVLPSVAAIAAGDAAATAAMQTAKVEGANLPFGNTRLRAYMQRVDHLADGLREEQESTPPTLGEFIPDYNQQQQQHSAGPQSAAGFPPSPSMQAPMQGGAGGGGVFPGLGGQPGMASQDGYGAALGELAGIRDEIARVEGVLNTLREPVERTTLGRPVIRKQPPPLKQGNRKDTFAQRKKEWEAAQVFGATQPVSRGEAVILEQTLEELLPAGMVTASLRTGKRSGGMQEGFNVHLFEKQYELVDMVLREAARQVHAGCHERGSVLEKLRLRYNEFFAAMKTLLFKLQQNYTLAAGDVQELRQQLASVTKDRTALSDDLTQHKAEGDFLRRRVESVEKEYTAHKDSTEAALRHLKTDNQMLEHELAHYEELLGKSQRQQEEAVAGAVASLEEELTSIIDERDDLMQRIRFLERQLTKAREEKHRAVPVDHAASQTEDQEQAGASGDSDEEEETEDDLKRTTKKPKKQKPKPKKKKKPESGQKSGNRGGFENLLRSDRVGRIKPKGQILKIIAQIYYEKIVVDSVDDREQNPRIPLPEFVYDWHLNRYGLRNLADLNLVDLIASCRNWQSSSLKIRLFGQFCGVLNAPYAGSLDHLNFYLYCMQVISSNITLLFPESEDVIYWIKPLRVLDIVRIVFPDFSENQALRDFMGKRVELLIDTKSKMYDADKVLFMLLEEWQRRTERNIAHLKALFRAGDSDTDGLLTYDEFLTLVRHADSLRSEREVVRMYREALQLSHDGETISLEAFVAVARSHGLSAWKIDYRISGLACSTPPTQSDPAQHDDALFSMLDNVLETTEDLDDQITNLKTKIGEDHETSRKIAKQYMFFQQKYKERDDADSTWLAYRVLIGEVRAAMIRYRGGIKKMVGMVKSSLAMKSTSQHQAPATSQHSTYTSSLQNMIQQSKEEAGPYAGVGEGGGGGGGSANTTGPGGTGDAGDTTAMSMLRGANTEV